MKHYDCKAFLRLTNTDLSIRSLTRELLRSTTPLSLIDFNIEYGVASVLSSASHDSAPVHLANAPPQSDRCVASKISPPPNPAPLAVASSIQAFSAVSNSQSVVVASPTVSPHSPMHETAPNREHASRDPPATAMPETDLSPVQDAATNSSDSDLADEHQSHSTPADRGSATIESFTQEMANSLPDIKQFVKQGLSSFSESLFSMFDKLITGDSSPDVITTHNQ